MQSAVRIRALMKKLAYVVEKYSCAVVLVGHMNKSKGHKKLYRGLGSIDISAVARSVLMIRRDDSDSSLRYLSQIKSNLEPEGDSLAFRIGDKNHITWLGKCNTEPKEEMIPVNPVITDKAVVAETY